LALLRTWRKHPEENHMLQVVGAGFGRTGTHSLALALETLGFAPCYTLPHVNRNPGHPDVWNDAIDGKAVDWTSLYQAYRSAVEWPSVSFLPQLLKHFPQARVVLTLRDAESWYESAAATIFPALEATARHPDPDTRARSSMQRRLILEQLFGGNYWKKAHAIRVYESHQEQVARLVPENRLLRYHVREGWGPLCAFLQVPPPEEPFPRLNERADFLATAPDWAIRVMRENAARRRGEADERPNR
jgi:hypothetical protein